MITHSPRASRSHCFGLHNYICVFCHRPLTYFADNGFGYCSASWTGRPERSDHAHWRFGPIQWRRAGVVAMLNVGPLAVAIVGNRWKLCLL